MATLGTNHETIIHEGNFHEFLPGQVVVDGERKAHGGKPRNLQTHPVGCYGWAPTFTLPKIPRSEWSQRCADKVAARSQLSDIRMTGLNGAMIPSRDQNGKGYCWAHSSTSSVLVLRAINHDPYADLSAYAVACIIKKFQDEGGWGAESMQFFIDRGCPTSQFWPQQSMSRSNDNAQTWANAALHKVTASFMDVPEGDFDAYATCLLLNCPGPVDENWWSHSIGALDLVDGASHRNMTYAASGKRATLQEFEAIWDMSNEVTGGFGVRIWNSWGDSWSSNGMGVLTGNKAIPDGFVAALATTASDV